MFFRKTDPRRTRFGRRPWAGLALAAFGAIIASALYVAHLPIAPITVAGLTRVIDGDSLMVGGTEIRLYGIDAPELNQRCRRDGRDVSCGKEASRQLVALIAGQVVTCERRDVDRYSSTVAVCRAGGVDLGQSMVAAGHAVAFGAYGREETSARAELKGIWASDFMRPRDWRDRERQRYGQGL